MDLARDDPGDCVVDSASGLGREKEEHEKTNLKERLKQQKKAEKSEHLDQLESW